MTDPNLIELARVQKQRDELVDQLASARAEVDILRQECDELRAQLAANPTAVLALLDEIERQKTATREAWKSQHQALDVAQKRALQLEALSDERDLLRSQLAGAEAANAATTETLVEHVELNGHVDIAEQCRDYLAHEASRRGGFAAGHLQDFVNSLRIVIDQLDRQRRSRNWYEAAYHAGKQKLIESAVDKALGAARIAAKIYAARVDDLGAAADDNDPKVMATAWPIGAAQADLWIALGIYEGTNG